MNDLFSANALLGGVLIGLAVVLFALLNGRAARRSGIVYGLIDCGPGEVDQSRLNRSCGWRLAFLSGLLWVARSWWWSTERPSACRRSGRLWPRALPDFWSVSV